jgi:hypothetical protein
MRKICFSMMAMVLTVLLAGPALATTVSVNFDAGTTNYITAVLDYPTSGDTMAGMTVQAYFAGGGSETATWISSGPGSGVATGTGWSLAQSGDTFPDSSLDNYWKLTNTGASPISKIRVDAIAGNIVFDTNDNATGTPGSELGYDFTVFDSSPSNFDIEATYRDAVALLGYNNDYPVGDLYRYLDIDFGNNAFGNGSSLEFFADTDTDASGNINPTPLPGTFLLLGSGLLALVGFRRISKV